MSQRITSHTGRMLSSRVLPRALPLVHRPAPAWEPSVWPQRWHTSCSSSGRCRASPHRCSRSVRITKYGTCGVHGWSHAYLLTCPMTATMSLPPPRCSLLQLRAGLHLHQQDAAAELSDVVKCSRTQLGDLGLELRLLGRQTHQQLAEQEETLAIKLAASTSGTRRPALFRSNPWCKAVAEACSSPLDRGRHGPGAAGAAGAGQIIRRRGPHRTEDGPGD